MGFIVGRLSSGLLFSLVFQPHLRPTHSSAFLARSFYQNTIVRSRFSGTVNTMTAFSISTETANATEPLVQTTSTAPSAKTIPPVHIYPVETDITELSQKYSQVKYLYYIRHAEGTHNVNKQYRDIANLDARLTDKGQAQCRELAKRIQASQDTVVSQLLESVELVVASPLTRCLQTALLSLEPIWNARSSIPIVAHEGVRETVNFNCDRRRNLTELAQEFPQVDFSHMPDHHDTIWQGYETSLGSDTHFTEHRESAQIYTVADRARFFFHHFLAQRPEQHVAVCSHRAFSRALWNFGIGQATNLPQALDDRINPENVPVVQYMGDESFEEFMRRDYDNCELRAMVVAFPSPES